MTLDRRQALSSGATAALGVGGAAVPTRASEAPAATGPNDRTIMEAWEQRRTLRQHVDQLGAQYDDDPRIDDICEPWFERIHETETRIMETQPDTAVGAAIKARLAFSISQPFTGNEYGEQAPDGARLDDNTMIARLMRDLETIAREG